MEVVLEPNYVHLTSGQTFCYLHTLNCWLFSNRTLRLCFKCCGFCRVFLEHSVENLKERSEKKQVADMLSPLIFTVQVFLKGVWHEIFDFKFFSRIRFLYGPWVSYSGHFKFWRKFVEIFATSCLSPVRHQRNCKQQTDSISTKSEKTSFLIFFSFVAYVVDTVN